MNPEGVEVHQDPERETDPEHLVLPQLGWNTFEPVPSRWNIFDPEGIWLGTVETPAAGYLYTAAAQHADGSDTATHFVLEVAQIGSIGRSLPPVRREFEL